MIKGKDKVAPDLKSHAIKTYRRSGGKTLQMISKFHCPAHWPPRKGTRHSIRKEVQRVSERVWTEELRKEKSCFYREYKTICPPSTHRTSCCKQCTRNIYYRLPKSQIATYATHRFGRWQNQAPSKRIRRSAPPFKACHCTRSWTSWIEFAFPHNS